MRTGNASTDNRYLGRRDTGHSSDQDPFTSGVILQQASSYLRCQYAADLASGLRIGASPPGKLICS
jgi:hypothetical protein